jgi:hypothetical protein
MLIVSLARTDRATPLPITLSADPGDRTLAVWLIDSATCFLKYILFVRDCWGRTLPAPATIAFATAAIDKVVTEEVWELE